MQGKSRRISSLWVADHRIEIRDARKLTGLDTVETQKSVRLELADPKVQTACIGLAEENLVKLACIRKANQCPFHALPVFNDEAYRCDLCGGKPQCVKVCTTQAIRTCSHAS